MINKPTYKIKVAGFGGQGILFLGRFIAELANIKGYNVTWLPSYGPEMRGGTANCTVIISKSSIPSPIAEETDILIALNQPSFEKFHKNNDKNGIIIIDPSLVKTRKRGVYKVDARKIAEEKGEKKYANMIIAGFLISKLRFYNSFHVRKALENMTKGKDVVKNNMKAVDIFGKKD